MNVKELAEKMNDLANQGYGEAIVKIWEPNTDNWETITVFVFDKSEVNFYTDEP